MPYGEMNDCQEEDQPCHVLFACAMKYDTNLKHKGGTPSDQITSALEAKPESRVCRTTHLTQAMRMLQYSLYSILCQVKFEVLKVCEAAFVVNWSVVYQSPQFSAPALGPSSMHQTPGTSNLCGTGVKS